jgi:2-methylcitrate dehydratase PrpD
VAADDLTAEYPASWGARLEVRTTSGTVLVERRHARGDPGHELTAGELADKVTTLAGPALGADKARDLAASLLGDGPPATLLHQVLPLLRRSATFQET